MCNASLKLANILLTSRTTWSLCQLPKRFASSDRLYTKTHEWISIQDDKKTGRVGITHHAQEALGDVVYVGGIEVGTKLEQFGEAGVIESVKAASDIRSPVSGEVTAFNSELEVNPGLVNKDCYGKGWLFEVKVDDVKELDGLMKEEPTSDEA